MGTIIVDNLAKAYGVEALFNGVSFEIRRGEKIGLVGANGTGKTTLFRCLLGQEQPDTGTISLPQGETCGYVEQDNTAKSGTLFDELRSAYQDILACQDEMRRLEAVIASQPQDGSLERLLQEYAGMVEQFERGGGYEWENRLRRVAFGLGFTAEDLLRPVSTFSGGQKTRISLARALIRQPDYLFLDEPTNHLDIAMVEWLEEFLAGYSGGVICISHDRYFLDKVAERIFELDNKKLTIYNGGYSEYLIQKTERLAALEASYEKQQAYIAKTQAYIDRYRAGIKSKQARGRQSQLDRLQRIESPVFSPMLAFSFQAVPECAERVAELEAVTACYGERLVFGKVSLLIRRQECVALVGDNGTGKSTLLKVLTGDVSPARGRVKLGSRVKIGYFDQEHRGLNLSRTVLDEIMDEFGFGAEQARSILGAFLFSGDSVFRVIGDLSGGEKARLSLLKLMLSGANFLLLDEPTNHLDIPSREAVEDALLAYPGTVLAVSHDRYFLDKVVERVLALDAGTITDYPGSYSYFREKQEAAKRFAKRETETKQTKESDTKKNGGKKLSPRQQQQDSEKRLKKLETEIQELEGLLAVLSDRLNDPQNHVDPENSQALAGEYAKLEEELAAKYEEWMELE